MKVGQMALKNPKAVLLLSGLSTLMIILWYIDVIVYHIGMFAVRKALDTAYSIIAVVTGSQVNNVRETSSIVQEAVRGFPEYVADFFEGAKRTIEMLDKDPNSTEVARTEQEPEQGHQVHATLDWNKTANLFKYLIFNATNDPKHIEALERLTTPKEQLEYLAVHIPDFNDAIANFVKSVHPVEQRALPKPDDVEKPKVSTGTLHGQQTVNFVHDNRIALGTTLTLGVAVLCATLYRRFAKAGRAIDRIAKRSSVYEVDTSDDLNNLLKVTGCSSIEELTVLCKTRGVTLQVTKEAIADLRSEMEHEHLDKIEEQRKATVSAKAKAVPVDEEHEKKYIYVHRVERQSYRDRGEPIPKGKLTYFDD